MSLDDIKKNLYKKDEDPNLSRHDLSAYSPEQTPLILNNQPESKEQDVWKEKEFELGKQGHKAIKISAIVFGVIVFLVAIIVGLYWYRTSSFSQDKAI
jgi:hypothetical protein